MTDALTVVNYFLALQEAEDAGDALTNLKLQKLLYYSQAYHLGATGEPLFPEKVEAWQHGPVVPDVYHSFKAHGANPIPLAEGFETSTIDEPIQQHLNEIWELFGQFSAWKLRNMTHAEKPYVDAFANGPNTEISHQSLIDFFAPLACGD